MIKDFLYFVKVLRFLKKKIYLLQYCYKLWYRKIFFWLKEKPFQKITDNKY